MEVTVEHLGSVQFEIKARQHTIACDQPPESGGFDEGMTPPELLLASLGSCAGFYAAQYLRKFKLSTEGTRVRVTADKVKDPSGAHRPLSNRDRNSGGVERTSSSWRRESCTALPDS